MNTNNFVTIANRGQALAYTNYFDSRSALDGLFFLSWNAGAGRLLVPDNQRHTLREIETSKQVIITAGPRPEFEHRPGFEMLFDDGTDYPFTLQMDAVQSDRALTAAGGGPGFSLVVWSRKGEEFRMPGRLFQVAMIPSLEPWLGK